MRSKRAAYGVFRYRGTRNLGDAIQTVALTRLLPGRTRGVERGDGITPPGTLLIANGWLGNNRLPEVEQQRNTLFAGVFVAQDHNLEWLRHSPFPIGARDPDTHDRLLKLGIQSEMIGCASLTFPRHRGRRTGVYDVDAGWYSPVPAMAIPITHFIPYDMPWLDQWRTAIDVLALYRRASLVYTSRLHVALPCIAFGTPVVFQRPGPTDAGEPLFLNRVSLLYSLGVVDGVPAEIDVQSIASSYRAFLSRRLGTTVTDHTPRFPL